MFILLIKFIVGLSLYWLYSNYYTNRFDADIFKFYDDSSVVFNAIFHKPSDFLQLIFSYNVDNEYFFDNYFINMNNWDSRHNSTFFNDSHTIIKLNAIIRIFSFGNYHIHTLFFCMMSVTGLFGLYKSVIHFFKGKEKILKYLLFFTPSVLFWSSGVLKEPIILLSLGLIFMSIYNLINRKKVFINLLVLILFLNCLFLIKFYVFVALIPVLIPFIFSLTPYLKKLLFNYGLSLLIFILIALSMKHISPNLDFIDILSKKQNSFIRMAEYNRAGSCFEIQKIESNLISVIKAVPKGIVNCFVRPLPWNISSKIQILPVVENIMILFFILLSIYHAFYHKTIKKIASYKFLLTCIFFTLILFSIIGISTPVAGALVRYKVPALPFLMMLLLLLVDVKKFYFPLFTNSPKGYKRK